MRILDQTSALGQTRSETLIALGGPNEIRAAELIVLAALLSHDEIAAQFARQIKSRLFADDLLRTIAEYSVGSLGTFGVTDLWTVERLLRVKFTDLAVRITIDTIHRLVDLIDASDVQDAIELLTKTARVAA